MMFSKNKVKRTEYDSSKTVKKENFTYMNKSICRRGQVIFAGDSITELLSTGDFFGEYTKETGLAVYNRGISGDTSNKLFERLRENVTSISPKCVVFLIGTNDLGFGLEPGFVEENVDKILALTKEDCPEAKIILQAVYPVNQGINKGMVGKRRNSDVLKVNDKLSCLAKKYDVTYLDFTEILRDENGNLRTDCSYDGLHLNAKGYELTVSEIMKHLPMGE